MKTLTIFYIFNYSKDIDIKYLDEYLRIFLNYNLSSKYNVLKVLNINTKINKNKDVIENGFFIFNELQTKIMALENFDPIKNSDFLFLYIANGSIFNKTNRSKSNQACEGSKPNQALDCDGFDILYDNVDVLLLNNNILQKKVFYTINTNVCNVPVSYDKKQKLENIKTFRSTLDNLFALSEQNILEY
jgi:hypothetical protein